MEDNSESQSNKWTTIALVAGGVLLIACLCCLFVAAGFFFFNGTTLFATSTPIPTETPLPTSTPFPTETLSPTSTPLPTDTQTDGLPFIEHFTTNVNGWAETTVTDEYGVITYTINGKYVWDANAKQPVNYKVWADSAPLVSDFTLAVEAQRKNGPQNSSYGVVFRVVDDQNFYFFAISDVGQYYVSKQIDGQWITLIDWTETPAILNGQVNTLSVTAIGNQFTFFINGEQVNIINDDAISSGYGGLSIELYTAGDQATFAFDNFEMKTP
jgi:hypothetical protein